jgi:hypothetical protein
LVGKHLPFQVQYHKNLAMLGKMNPITDPVEVNLDWRWYSSAHISSNAKQSAIIWCFITIS